MTLVTKCLRLSLLTSLLLGWTDARKFTKAKDAVRLQDISTLTFYKDRETTHRRVSALPQITCVSGSGCKHYEPDSIRCVNSGASYDASSIEWTCTASLPPEVKLGSTEVICEGYDDPDDEYVLKGSCALEYRLLLTDLGYDKLGGRSEGTGSATESNTRGAFLAAAIFWVIFVGVAGWILFSLWKAVFRPSPDGGIRRQPERRGWNGGWDDDGDDDPPPPYTPYNGRNASKPKSQSTRSGQAGSNRASSSRAATSENRQGNQRPWWQTFGAGAAAGGAAGYWAANARNPRREQELRDREQVLNMQERQRDRSWADVMFGGAQNRAGPSRPAPYRQPSDSNGSFSGGMSNTRYESTGFGGTRRR